MMNPAAGECMTRLYIVGFQVGHFAKNLLRVQTRGK